MSVGLDRLIGVALLATVCALAMSSIAAAATPAAVRACVERGLTRYTGPADAVAAQYADLETACIAALDSSEVTVDFSSGAGGNRPDPSPEGSGEEGAGSPAPSGSPGEQPSAGTAEADDPADQPGQSAAPNRTRTSVDTTPAATATVAELVRQSVEGSRASSGTPLPRALGELPAWLLGMVIGSVALIGSGIVLGLRKRPH